MKNEQEWILTLSGSPKSDSCRVFAEHIEAIQTNARADLQKELDEAMELLHQHETVMAKAVDQVFSELTSITGENRTAWIWQEADKLTAKTHAFLARHRKGDAK